MRKTTFWTLALLMVSALMSMGLSSCSSDDDDDNVSSELYGKWDFDYQSQPNLYPDYDAYEFKKGGKGYAEEWYDSNGHRADGGQISKTKSFPITYTYDENAKRLVIHFDEDGDDHEWDDILIVKELTTNKLVINEGGSDLTYLKK